MFTNCKALRSLYNAIRLQSTSTCYYDVVISGGGMVGCALGLSLKQNCPLLKVCVIEREGGDKTVQNLPPNIFHSRTSALNRQSCNLLRGLNVWSELERSRIQPVKKMQIWDACSESCVTFSDERTPEPLAYIVENNLLTNCMRLKLHQHSMLISGKITNVSDAGRFALVLKTEKDITLKTRLLVIAEGFNSHLRRLCGFQVKTVDYQQDAVVSILKLSQVSDNTTAYQIFLPTGPIGILPLSSEYSNIIWSADTQLAQKLMKISEAEFCTVINNSLTSKEHKSVLSSLVGSSIIKAIRVASSVLPSNGLFETEEDILVPPQFSEMQSNSRGAFSLSLIHATSYVKPRVVLIGDSAHRIHPLAGQGVNLGFADVDKLTSMIENQLECGGDIGNVSFLKEFERSRQPFGLGKALGMDFFKRFFGTDSLPVVLARSAGMTIFEHVKPFKRMALRMASRN